MVVCVGGVKGDTSAIRQTLEVLVAKKEPTELYTIVDAVVGNPSAAKLVVVVVVGVALFATTY